jgi:AcrR family transcriptional regulator
MPPISPRSPHPRRAAPAPAERGARQRVLEAAREQFFASGFSLITMDDLAAAVGMSKKTLYQLFPSKEALLETLITERAQEMRQAWQAIAQDSAASTPDKLRRTIAMVVSRLADIQPAFVFSLKRHAPEQYRRVQALRRQNLQLFLGQLLAEGRARGVVRADLNERLVVEMLLETLHALLEPETLQRLELMPARAAGLLLDLLCQGLLTEKGKTAYVASE